METTLQKFLELAKTNKKSIEQITIKLQEETGEVSSAVLSALGAFGSEYKNENLNDVKEELIDVIMIACSLLVKLEASEKEVQDIFKDKVQKWDAVTSVSKSSSTSSTSKPSKPKRAKNESKSKSK